MLIKQKVSKILIRCNLRSTAIVLILLLNKQSLCTASTHYNFAHFENGAEATSADTAWYGPTAVNDGKISICVDSDLLDPTIIFCDGEPS
jgi:hypothetical protein